MDTLGLYTAMRRDIIAVRSQAERFSGKITANTITASDLHDGLRTNGFEVMFTRLSIHWDASDAAIDLTTQDYNFPLTKLQQWGVEPSVLMASLTERDRTKLVNFWRADKVSATYNPSPDLANLRTSMIEVRNEVITIYPTGVGGLDEGITIDSDGERVTKIFDAREADTLKPLLDITALACAALLS